MKNMHWQVHCRICMICRICSICTICIFDICRTFTEWLDTISSKLVYMRKENQIWSNYAVDMQEKMQDICQVHIQYAYNMHENMHQKCTKYAWNMQNYVYMQICKVDHDGKNAWKNEKMQNMQNMQTMPKICKMCTPHLADEHLSTDPAGLTWLWGSDSELDDSMITWSCYDLSTWNKPQGSESCLTPPWLAPGPPGLRLRVSRGPVRAGTGSFRLNL
jgi:hypothetical protein